MKNILLLTDGFPYRGGDGAFLETEFRHLHSHYQVFILASGSKNLQMAESFPPDVPVTVYLNHKLRNVTGAIGVMHLPIVAGECQRAEKYVAGVRNKLTVNFYISKYYFLAKTVSQQIEKIVESNHIEVIYAFWGHWFALAAAMIADRFPDVKLIVRFHGYDLYHERSPIGYQPFRNYIADHAERLLFVGNAGKRYFVEHWGGVYAPISEVRYLGTKKYPLIYQSEEGEPKGSTASEYCIISCSNVNSIKRVDLIAEALSKLPTELSVTWIHVGDGPLTEQVQKKIKTYLSGRPSIRWKFTGKVDHDKITGVYEQYRPDLFITASSTEGLPVSIQEAFAMGIPAVGTAVGGIPELIHDGRTGFLCSSDPSPEELSEAIMKYVHLTAAEKEDMHRNCLEFWKEHCDAEVNAEEMVRLIAEL